MMKTVHFKILRIAATVLIAIVALVASTATSTTAATSALDFSNTMRKLWEDHVMWTRLYIISVAADLPDREATTQRLLQNQVDIGNAIKPFYGDAAGEQLTALLKDHILGAAELLDAAKANDTAGVEAAKVKWSANANDIAAFLNQANPENWPLAEMRSSMQMHLDMTLDDEATPRLKGDFAADIQGYDEVHQHILSLADTLSTGIINQFPDQFDQSTMNEFPLRSAMRELWEDHVMWTRLYIISVAADLPDREATTQRLLQNQVDIGNAIKPFYGDAAGEQLTALLKDHILGAAELLDAAKANDTAGVEAAKVKWSANANDIAAFLNQANPENWPLAEMRSSMQMHLDMTLDDEAAPRLKGDFAADIKGYDEVHQHILGLADTLSTGIINQFPNKVAQPAPGHASAPAELPATGASHVHSTPAPAWLAVLVGSLLVTLGIFTQRGVWK